LLLRPYQCFSTCRVQEPPQTAPTNIAWGFLQLVASFYQRYSNYVDLTSEIHKQWLFLPPLSGPLRVYKVKPKQFVLAGQGTELPLIPWSLPQISVLAPVLCHTDDPCPLTRVQMASPPASLCSQCIHPRFPLGLTVPIQVDLCL
jgi:hypothetical protein